MTLVCFSFLLLLSSYAQGLSDGLMAYYSFGGNALDDSGRGHHGTVVGATLTADREGRPDSAYYFNGNGNYIEVPDHDDLDLTNDFSICGWIRADVLGEGAPQNNYVIGKHLVNVNGDGSWGLQVSGVNQALWLDDLNGGIMGCQPVPSNVWVHFALVYEKASSQWAWYRNGSLETNGTKSMNLQNTAWPINIGREQGRVNGNFFHGAIDELRIYKRALTASEVLEACAFAGDMTARIFVDAGTLEATATEGENPGDASFRAWYSGEGALSYTNTSSAAWLSVSPSSGISTGEQDLITLHFDAGLLAEGVYSATVTVADVSGVLTAACVTVRLAIYGSDSILTYGLVAYYPFNGNAQDESGREHHGAVIGATLTADRNNEANSAYYFGGDGSHISVADHDDLDLTEDFTISAWIKPQAYGGGNPPRNYVIGKHRVHVNYDGSWGMQLHEDHVLWFDDMKDGVRSVQAIPTNLWCHIALVYEREAQQWRWYHDGEADGEGIKDLGIQNTVRPLVIGREEGRTDGNFFFGAIDEVRIYRRALPSSQVALLYQHEKAISNTPPIIHLAASPTSGMAILRVTFDLSGSQDAENNIRRTLIDREGDGIYETTADGAAIVLVDYALPGVFTARVSVVDAWGLEDETSVVISVSGAMPTAVLSANPASGAAPLAVELDGRASSAGPGHVLCVYEWDFNGDGTYDEVSTNGIASWIYRTEGSFSPALRVTDDVGLQSVASAVVTVEASMNPPTATLSASPEEGTIPLEVQFTASATDDGMIVEYRWDFDGDRQVDQTSSNAVVTHVYSDVGTFDAMVTVVDDDGLSASASITVKAVELSQYKVWISRPKDGDTVWGDALSLTAHVAPANKTMAVRFEYRTEGGSWTPIGDPVYPQPRAYHTTWDVTGFTNGTLCELRVAALVDPTITNYSPVYAVTVSDGAFEKMGTVETRSNMAGKHEQQQAVDVLKSTSCRVYDGTLAVFPAGAFASNTTMSLELTGAGSQATNGAAAGLLNVGSGRTVHLVGDPVLQYPIELLIPYADADQDGIVDGIGIKEETLVACWFSQNEGEWKRPLDSKVYPEDNVVGVTAYQTGEYGLFGAADSAVNDLDGDGMPDAWEMHYFGTLDLDGTGDYDGDGLPDSQEFLFRTNPALKDSDGDGQSDYAEWRSHTDALDPMERFELAPLAAGMTNDSPVIIAWDSQTGLYYSVFSTTNLLSPDEGKTNLHRVPGTGRPMSYSEEWTNLLQLFWLKVEGP